MRKNKFAGRTRSVRTSLLVSYLVVLTTPILLSTIVFSTNYAVVQEQTSQVFSVTDEHLTALVNTYVEEVRDESLSLILSDSSKVLMSYRSTTPTVPQILQLGKLQKEMLYKTTVSGYIQAMYAIFPKSDVILSDRGVFYNHNFSYKCREDLGMTLEEWDDFMCFEGDRRISILKSTLDGSDRILIAQKSQSAGGDPDMLIITALDVSTFLEILNDLSQDGRFLAMIYDRDSGNALFSSSTPEKLSYQMEKGEVVSDNAVISSRNSDFGNWVCALLTPREAYRAAMKPFFFSIALYLLICLFTGVLLIVFLSKRQYSPVQKIMNQMLASAGLDALPAERNEYEQIQQALTVLLRQRTSMKEENTFMRKSFQEHVLRNILSGRINKDSIIYRHACNNGVMLDSGRFAVVLYDIEDFGKSFSRIDSDLDSDEFLAFLLDVIVYAAARDNAQDRYRRYAVEIDGRIVCIACCPEEPDGEEIENDMLRDAETVSSFLRARFDLTLSAAISGVHADMENINLCYREALEAADYMETMGMATRSCRYSQIVSGGSKPLALAEGVLEKERQFCNCVKGGDFATSRQLLEEILEELNLEGCSAAAARLRVFGLAGVVMPALEDAGAELNAEIECADPDTLLQTKDVNGLCAQMMKALDRLAESAARQKQEKPSRQKERFVQYIAENLTDPNMNVTGAAEHFSMSPSHFSRTFKKYLGVGFLDYIHQRRVDLAKEMIQRYPAMPLKDIAEKVGYTTPLALNRAFRKYEGISPSVFREHLAG